VVNPIKEISLSLSVLTKVDQKKFKLILLIQACLGFLDLFGVAVLGVVGSLAIRGVQSAPAGDRVSQVLEWLNILNFSLQSQVAILGIIAVLVLVLKTIASVILTRRILRFLSRKSFETSADLVKRVFLIPELGIKARTSHELQYAIGPGVSALCIGVLGSASTLASDFSLLVILATGLLIYDPVTATTVTMIFSLVGIALYLLMFRRARRISAKIVKYNILSNKTLLEAIQTYREIYVRNRREFYISRIAKMKEEISTSIAEQAFMPSISKYVIEVTLVVGALMLSAILFITQDASHAVAGLALFIASGSRIGPALLRLQQSLVQVQSSYAEAEPSITLIKSLYNEILPESNLDAEVEKPFVGDVVISNLNFSYPDSQEPTLSDINLVIPSGSTLAIVGPSGSGKSTLVDLLLGVHLPNSGSVLISSQPPRRAIVIWPGKVAYVPQDVRIVEGSICENIALGYNQADIVDSRIQKSVEISQLSSMINELAQGVYSQVGEFGTKLSGGQRQRIGIARALYTNPELLVLDEATSSLDGQTESEVSTAINNIKGTITTIVVAHRLSTVKESDQIIYLEAGKIRASGNFEQIRSQVADFDVQANLMGL
jgi:ABC-type multidrug transport system fused ATPase/permease subunit